MSAAGIFAVTAALLVGFGLFGLISQAHPVRRILAFNLIGSGILLLFGALGTSDPGAGPDPVPQAMVITGIVVALAATALAVALAIRLAGAQQEDSAAGSAGDGDRPST